MMREEGDRWKNVDRLRQQVREDIGAFGLEPESTQQADSYICGLYRHGEAHAHVDMYKYTHTQTHIRNRANIQEYTSRSMCAM